LWTGNFELSLAHALGQPVALSDALQLAPAFRIAIAFGFAYAVNKRNAITFSDAFAWLFPVIGDRDCLHAGATVQLHGAPAGHRAQEYARSHTLQALV
jgi:hypothetical protein